MLKIKLFVLFLLPILIFGGKYSIVPTESSPWGIVAVWNGEYNWKDYEYREKYMPQIDSSISCGLSWNRPNCVPSGYGIHKPNGQFDFAEIDSFVLFMQEKGLNTLYAGWPANSVGNYVDSINGYYQYFRALVERYDGDGESYTTDPWGQIIEEPEWLTKPIKYWNICNEPYAYHLHPNNDAWGWPAFRNRTIEDFRTFLRVASRGIHDADPDAKVVGPCIHPLHDAWEHKKSRKGYVWVDSVCCLNTSGNNIIKNYGFEDSLNFWHIWENTYPSWTVVTDGSAFQGISCLYSDSIIDFLDRGGINAQYPKYSEDIIEISDVLSDTDTAFSVSCYLKTDSLIGAVYLRVRVYDSNYTDTTYYMSPCITGTNEWFKLENVINRSELSDSAWKFCFYIYRATNAYYNMKPTQLWQEIFRDGIDTCIDVINVHEYWYDKYNGMTNVQTSFKKMDSMKVILDNLGLGDKPIWVTEGSIEKQEPDTKRALMYKEWAEGMLTRDWFTKMFFFSLKWDVFAILDPDWVPYPPYDTLQDFIHKYTPYINLVSPKEYDILIPGQSIEISYGSLIDRANVNPSGALSVRSEYSIDGGKSYNLIGTISNAPPSGAHEWTPPDSILSMDGRVRVVARDSDGLEGASESKVFFRHSPLLFDGIVSPEIGVDSAEFIYSVRYSDGEGYPPTTRRVFIDGVPHEMTLSSGTPSNGTYSYNTYLSHANHTYYFYFEDINLDIYRLPETGSYSGPIVDNFPVLSNAAVNPRTGNESTTYVYSVDYFDEDGDVPTMKNVVIDDVPYEMTLSSGTPSNGTYSYDTTLSSGEHKYYFYFEDGFGGTCRVPATGSSKGPTVIRLECEMISVNQSNSSEWHTLDLSETYDNSIVVMGPLSCYGRDPTTMRVKDVTSSGFKFQLDEWDYLDGTHKTEEIPYIVMEDGLYYSVDIGLWEAGSITDVGTTWKTVNLKYGGTLDENQIILTQIVTCNDPAAAVTRVKDITENNFKIKLQEEEGADGYHSPEVVHYIAMQPKSGIFDNRKFLVSKTGNSVTHEWYNLDLADNPSGYAWPVFVAGMQTCDENDPCALRQITVSDISVRIKVEEEQSADSEVVHTTEDVGYMVMWAPALVPVLSSNDATTKIEEVFENYIKLPASVISGNLILNVSSNYERKASVELIDIVGRVVERRNLNLKKGRENINLGEFISGVYFLRILSDEDKNSEVHKITVLR